jgi:hypothetical protein
LLTWSARESTPYRSVPSWAKRNVDEWIAAADIADGTIFRRVSRLDKIWGDGITPSDLARGKSSRQTC